MKVSHPHLESHVRQVFNRTLSKRIENNLKGKKNWQHFSCLTFWLYSTTWLKLTTLVQILWVWVLPHFRNQEDRKVTLKEITHVPLCKRRHQQVLELKEPLSVEFLMVSKQRNVIHQPAGALAWLPPLPLNLPEPALSTTSSPSPRAGLWLPFTAPHPVIPCVLMDLHAQAATWQPITASSTAHHITFIFILRHRSTQILMYLHVSLHLCCPADPTVQEPLENRSCFGSMHP